MKTLDIPRDQWRHFCERLSELHHDSMVTIEWDDPENGEHTIGENEPLQAILFDDESDACNDLIVIETADRGKKGKQHRIIEPVHVRLKNGQNDRYNNVEIQAESGITIIRLHPGLTQEVAEEFVYQRVTHRQAG